MPLTLRTRIEPDTLGKMERAATRRFAEAMLLVKTEPLGAIYLLGYTVEIRLKAATYRLQQIPANWDINSIYPPNLASPRRLAEREIKSILGAAAPPSVGHHLLGWVQLLIASRIRAGLPPMQLQGDLLNHVQNVALCWSESLRYHANKPYTHEQNTVLEAARWVKSKYRQLWS